MKLIFECIHNFFGEKVKTRMLILFILPVIGSFFETLGISVVVSFITIVLDETALETNRLVNKIYHLFSFSSYRSFIVFIAGLLICFYIMKTVYLSAAYQIQNRIVRNAQREVGQKVFQIILKKPYEYFSNVNAAEVIRIINDDVIRCMEYVMTIIQMFTEILVIIFLLGMLLVQNWGMTIFISTFLAVGVSTIRIISKKRIAHGAENNQKYRRDKMKWLNQSVYGIKDIKIAQTEKYFCERYDQVNKESLKNDLEYSFWQKVPQYLIEMVIMICVLLYILVMVGMGVEVSTLVPIMTTFALAAVRLLPACNRISSHLTQIFYRTPSAKIINEILYEKDLSVQNADISRITIEEKISLKNIDFSYSDSDNVLLHNVNLDIKAGMAIGIIGPSGAGKTTLVDIILGLLKPQDGNVLADGIDIEEGYKSYLDKIAYIPQNIFLTDDTIRNNVAFGIEEERIDDALVLKALEEAQLTDFISTLPDGVNTMVGDQGARISGGQKQRIGIARALYKNPQVLVLDEATSALDNETEAAIMESIHHLKGKKTMIIIAHRLSTIKDCDVVYEVKDGSVSIASAIESV